MKTDPSYTRKLEDDIRKRLSQIQEEKAPLDEEERRLRLAASELSSNRRRRGRPPGRRNK